MATSKEQAVGEGASAVTRAADTLSMPGDITPAPRSTRILGRCRRHAPTMSGYPVVTTADWCGDHKLREGNALSPQGEDPWANRGQGMRCASCMYFVEKRGS